VTVGAISSADFEELYRAHAGEILGYLSRRADASDAADLLAETFLCAWRRRSDLPAPDQRRAWLFTTARRLLLAHYRHPAPRPVPTVEPRQPSPAITDGLNTDIVAAVLAELREHDRELLTLTVWEHLPVVEAGRILGLSGGAARVRLHRIRQRLAADPRLVGLVEVSSSRMGGTPTKPHAQDPAPSGGVAQPAAC
jgi:RNA polymerase sigma-70 factor (ECF subfamily)